MKLSWQVAMEANPGKDFDNMKYIRNTLLGLNADKHAVTAVEYALMAGLIAVAIAGTVTALSGKITTVLTSVSSAI